MRPLTRRIKTSEPPFQTYQDRDALLMSLGFESYSAYLASPLWKKIRARVICRDDGKCVICKAPYENVHHKAYNEKVLTGRKIGNLACLCRECHRSVEFSRTGYKLDFPEVDFKYKKAKRKADRRQKKEGRRLRYLQRKAERLAIWQEKKGKKKTCQIEPSGPQQVTKPKYHELIAALPESVTVQQFNALSPSELQNEFERKGRVFVRRQRIRDRVKTAAVSVLGDKPDSQCEPASVQFHGEAWRMRRTG